MFSFDFGLVLFSVVSCCGCICIVFSCLLGIMVMVSCLFGRAVLIIVVIVLLFLIEVLPIFGFGWFC